MFHNEVLGETGSVNFPFFLEKRKSGQVRLMKPEVHGRAEALAGVDAREYGQKL